jgi:hypothetical protein
MSSVSKQPHVVVLLYFGPKHIFVLHSLQCNSGIGLSLQRLAVASVVKAMQKTRRAESESWAYSWVIKTQKWLSRLIFSMVA